MNQSQILLRKIGGRFDACWRTAGMPNVLMPATTGTRGAKGLRALVTGVFLPLLLFVAFAGAFAFSATIAHAHGLALAGGLAVLRRPERKDADPDAPLTRVVPLIESLGTRFTEFKQSFETRLAELETKGARPSLVETHGPRDDARTRELKTAFGRWALRGELPAEQKAMSVGSDPDGGYAVPQELSRSIENFAGQVNPMRVLATVDPVASDSPSYLVNKRGTGSGWVGEAAARPATNTPQLEKVEPSMGEIYANPQITQRLEDDAFFNAGEFLAENIGTEFGEQEVTAFVTGDGVNKPKGFLAGPAPVATGDAARAFGVLQYVPTGVADGFAAATAAVSPADVLILLVYTLRAAYRANAAWQMNSATAAVLRQWKDANGAFIWQTSLVAGQPDRLFGYPVHINEGMPDIAANAFPIAFGDWRRGYVICDRIARVLRDPYTNKPYIGFYATKRVGGGLLNSEAIKLLKIAAA